MKNKTWLLSVALLLAISLVASGCPPQPEDPGVPRVPEVEVITWRIQSMHAAGSVIYGVFADFFVPLVYQMTGGQLRIIPFAAGAVVPIAESYSAVARELFEGAHQASGHWVGIEPAHAFVRSAMGAFYEVWQHDMWKWVGGANEITREIYAQGGLHFIAPIMRPGESMHFRERLTSLADFRGMKLRTPPGMTAELFIELGATPVMLPPGELYSALDKGLIDAVEWMGLADNYGLGIHEVTGYFLFPSFHSPVGVDSFFVHKRAWEELPEHLRAAVEAAARVWSAQTWYVVYHEDAKTRDKYIAAGNVEVFLTPEEWKEVADAAIAVWKDWGRRSPLAGKIMENQMAFQRVIGILD